jgi:shikimate kinase
MRVSLIGMSGSGKSYWSRKLAGRGFWRFCCDDLIAARLAPELTRPGGGTLTVGEWLGFPYQSHYHEREALYLAHEVAVLAEILGQCDAWGDSDGSVVVDTTGSVIYTGKDLLVQLRCCTTAVHLATPAEVQERMLAAYLADLRPVLWHGMFEQRAGETAEEALARCYPLLLASRERLYAQCAHVTVDYHTRHSAGFGVDDLLKRVTARV